MKKILIYGASGHATAIYDLVINQQYKVSYFLDDKKKNNLNIDKEKKILGSSAINDFLKKNKNKKLNFVIAIGSNQKTRYKIFNKLRKNKFNLPTIVHSNAHVSKFSKIGNGCQIFANTNIGPFSSIGDATIINNNSNVDHECKIGKSVHIAPGAIICGNVEIGDYTLIGANSTILPGIKIGSNCIIGAGSVVLKNIKSNKKFY